jgi:hypothetical protein
MPVADTEIQGEVLQAIARSMASNNTDSKKEDTRIYWKRPMIDPSNGKPDAAPGWIMWGSDDMISTSFRDSWFIYGRQPLPQYGHLRTEEYGPWGTILSHPNGPAEFPVEQIQAFGWYDPAQVPVPGVKFPQLQGLEIIVYDCPECTNKNYLEPVHLARHLRNTHDWQWRDIAAYGEEQGILFAKERGRNGRGRIKYDFTDGAFAEELERAAAGEDVEDAQPVMAAVKHVQTSIRKRPPMSEAHKLKLRQARMAAIATKKLAAKA